MPKSAVIETYQYLSGSLGRRGAPRDVALGRRVRETVVPRRTRELFVSQVRLAAERGLTAGTLAEASLRLDEHRLLITAPGSWAASFGEDDLRIGALHEHKSLAQEEMPPHANWHRAIYLATDAMAVLLSQPPAALAAAACRSLPAPELLEDAARDLGPLALLEITNPTVSSPDDDGLDFSPLVEGRRALLLPGYGVLSWGDDLPQAIARAEMVDRWCDVMLKN